jgi:hypothetical protein
MDFNNYETMSAQQPISSNGLRVRDHEAFEATSLPTSRRENGLQ